jgi:hypothetical protein
MEFHSSAAEESVVRFLVTALQIRTCRMTPCLSIRYITDQEQPWLFLVEKSLSIGTASRMSCTVIDRFHVLNCTCIESKT